MGRRWFRPRGARVILAAGLIAAISAVAMADRYLGDRAPWRSRARLREEAEALARGRDALDRGRFRLAIRVLSGIRRGSPSEAEALTVRGLAEANIEEVGPARRDLERAWQLRPNAAAARVLAAIYLGAGETERGFQMLMNASRIEPEDYRPWHAMGELIHLPLRRYEPAIAAFREALKRRPGHLESRIGLVEALVRFHRPRDAEEILGGVLRDRPDDARVVALAAEVYLELGRDREAESSLERSLSLDPDRRESLILLARQRVRQGRPREALAAAGRACDLEPNDPAALALFGSIQASLGLKDEAARSQERRRRVEQCDRQIEAMMRAILERPDDPEPRCQLGRTAAEAGRKALAVQSYQAALALAPDCRAARDGLAELGARP